MNTATPVPQTATPVLATGTRSPLLWVPTGYFTMALGYTMLCSVTAIMFKNLGMDNGQAAAYSSMLILAYTIKPLFAPIVEMYRTKKFFVLCTQCLIGLGFFGAALAMSLPNYMVVLLPLFWAMSFIGATQDIASDGVYVTSLDSRAQSLYCGVQSLSWNIGPIVASGALVYLSGRLHTEVFHHDARAFGPDWMQAWQVIFAIVGAITVVMALWHARVMPDGARAD
ncbi:MAG TPA: MFS transporter, partial [Telluria sp.]